jgi:hypothetical protein
MNFIYFIYYSLPNFERFGFIGKVINKLLEMLLKRIFDRIVPNSFRKTAASQPIGINTVPRDKKYIVSLTSFPGRINEVWIAIECILRQTFKPDAIILYLSKEQFNGVSILQSLLDLEKRGLTIKFCEEDIKAHKKYFYAMKEYPNEYIITLDDDLYYDNKTLERVVNLHLKFPNLIAANRAHKITFNKNNELEVYKKWERRTTCEEPSHLIFSTGGGGTLYPPNALNDVAFNLELIKKLSFLADDVWLKAMAILSKKMVVTNNYYSKNIISISKTQKIKLVSENVKNGGNDFQLKNLCEHFNIDLSDYAEKK